MTGGVELGSKKRGSLEGRRRTWRVAVIVVAVLVLVGAGTAVAVTQFGGVNLFGSGAVATAAAPPLQTPAPQVLPVPANAPMPSPAELAAALAPTLANPGLGSFTGQVSDAETGQVLWQQGADTPQAPGSVTKVLTSAAALLTLPLDQRLTTKVVQGAAPGQVVLVGAGDPTLTAQPDGETGFYLDAPHVSDLADQLRRAGTPVTSVVVDKSLFPGPGMAKGWDESDIAGGNISPIESVMLDGGRLNPTVDESPRSPTPALYAGQTLAKQLGLDAAAVTVGTAPAGAQTLASVQSAPLSERLHELMTVSDNVLAETVGLEVAKARGQALTFDGAVAAVTQTLQQAGFDTTGLTLKDVNGLSTLDRIPARLVDQVLTAAAGPSQPKLRPLLDDLPVAGGTGTLADRFDHASAAAAGWTRAKTGTLSGVSSLAGVVTTVDNRVLTFALMSNGTSPDQARTALDAVAAALRSCGCR